MEHLFSDIERQDNELLLVELFKAYRSARKNKRAKRSQLAFEFEHEKRNR